MTSGKIDDATRVLGRPADWDPEKHGNCGDLAIRDQVIDGINRMYSVWELSDAERAAIAAGGRIILSVCGEVHPPVGLMVEAP